MVGCSSLRVIVLVVPTNPRLFSLHSMVTLYSPGEYTGKPLIGSIASVSHPLFGSGAIPSPDDQYHGLEFTSRYVRSFSELAGGDGTHNLE
ncbi:MAG: hypothetical protein A4E38_00017 [Methanoregulaceae archaeon PtaB.Bin108]|nr:MAG: hypothetical protein A4E38_00017 [Methanoregulaceae archaeon PtaB.Bin108]